MRTTAIRRFSVSARILNQVTQGARKLDGISMDVKPISDVRLQLKVRRALGFLNQLLHQCREIKISVCARLCRTSVVQKLRDDGLHLCQIRLHPTFGLIRQRAHLDFQQHTRDRRAQIMRDTRKNHGPV